jgi:hypothetical protein
MRQRWHANRWPNFARTISSAHALAVALLLLVASSTIAQPIPFTKGAGVSPVEWETVYLHMANVLDHALARVVHPALADAYIARSDVDGDNLPELLVMNGGEACRGPYCHMFLFRGAERQWQPWQEIAVGRGVDGSPQLALRRASANASPILCSPAFCFGGPELIHCRPTDPTCLPEAPVVPPVAPAVGADAAMDDGLELVSVVRLPDRLPDDPSWFAELPALEAWVAATNPRSMLHAGARPELGPAFRLPVARIDLTGAGPVDLAVLLQDTLFAVERTSVGFVTVGRLEDFLWTRLAQLPALQGAVPRWIPLRPAPQALDLWAEVKPWTLRLLSRQLSQQFAARIEAAQDVPPNWIDLESVVRYRGRRPEIIVFDSQQTSFNCPCFASLLRYNPERGEFNPNGLEYSGQVLAVFGWVAALRIEAGGNRVLVAPPRAYERPYEGPVRGPEEG